MKGPASRPLHSESVEHLRNAIDIEDERGAVIYRAHAALDLARVLIESEGASEDVRELLDSVRAIDNSSGFHRVFSRLSSLDELAAHF